MATSDAASKTLRMSNFPASWVAASAEANLPTKIKDLLEKFGALVGPPIVSRPDGGRPIAQATFVDADHAEAAAKALDNVDNRTAVEKRKAKQKAPKETEKFSVKMGAAIAAPTAENGEGSVRILIRELPLEWSAQDVRELCGQYGKVDEITADGAGRHIITFALASTADLAAGALSGLQVQSDAGVNTLRTDILKAATVGSAGSEDGPGFQFYIDEIQLAAGDPIPGDKEIFLRDLPLEDYDEPQLREWLDSFGDVDRVVFLKDHVKNELTGKGYVRFKTHDEAVGLIAAFPTDDEEGNVQGTWSLSERLGSAGAALRSRIAPKLKDLATTVGCSNVALLGDGAATEPLHFGAWPREASSKNKSLEEKLKEVVSDAVGFADKQRSQRSSAAPPAATASAVAPAAAGGTAQETELRPSGPCVLVQGFPISWNDQQLKLVFALFGGVASVRFGKGPSGSRMAQVELKIPDNMAKAVEQLNNTQVGDGDLIEACTITCEVYGIGGEKRKGPAQRVIFLDDLSMQKRPTLSPGKNDREVFLTSLPVQDCTEEQIKAWLEGFGGVADLFLLRDDRTGALTGKGYVTFVTHDEAAACVEAQASAADAEEGDVVAAWSESERANQRAESVYGLDVHNAFAGPSGRVLASILVTSKAKELYLFSDHIHNKDRGAPDQLGRQLHFITTCDDLEYDNLRAVLGRALESFHDKAAKRVKDTGGGKDKDKLEKEQAATSKAPGPPGYPGGASAPWGYPPPAAPPGSWAGPYGPPPGGPPGWFSGPPGYPGAGPPGAFSEPGRGGCPSEWRGAAPPPGFGPPPGSEQIKPPPGDLEDASGRNDDDEDDEVTTDPELRKKIHKGEDLVKQGVRHLEKDNVGKAYDKYCRGLQYLLEVVPKLTDITPKARDLRMRINGYLDAAEVLKQRLAAANGGAPEADGPPGAHGAVQDAPTVSAPRSDRRERSKAAPAAEDDDDNATQEQPHSEEETDPNLPLEARVKMGEALIAEGQAIEQTGQRLDQGYEKYCRGLQHLLEVMPKIPPDSPGVTALRGKITGYLEQAEKLKERLDAEVASGKHKEEADAPDGAQRKKRRRKTGTGAADVAAEAGASPTANAEDNGEGGGEAAAHHKRRRRHNSTPDAGAGQPRDDETKQKDGDRDPGEGGDAHRRRRRKEPQEPGSRAKSAALMPPDSLGPPPPPPRGDRGEQPNAAAVPATRKKGVPGPPPPSLHAPHHRR